MKELLDYGYNMMMVDHLIWLELWTAMTATDIQSSRGLDWGSLPLVTGFEYQAICHIPRLSEKKHLSSFRERVKSPSFQFSLYDQFRSIAVRRDKHIWVTLITVQTEERKCQKFDKCRVITTAEARNQFEFSVQLNQSFGSSIDSGNDETVIDQLFPKDAKATWLLMTIDGTRDGTRDDTRVLLRQKLSDDVTVSLDFQDAGSCWPSHFKSSKLSKLYENTRKALSPWFEASAAQEPWQRWKISEAACRTDIISGSSFADDPFNTGFDPLFRLYWAVATGREALAELLWSRTSHPLIAGFLCSYVCREMAVIRGKESLSLTHAWDTKIDKLMTQLALDIGTDSIKPLFNEYVFIGKDDEAAIMDKLTTEEHRENTRRRAVLALLNVDGERSQTRVDLAIYSVNERFLGHALTEQFLRSVWRNAGGNGVDFVASRLGWSPRTKYYTHLMGMVWLLVLFLLTWLSAPSSHGNDEDEFQLKFWEILFWFCVPCGFCYEVVQFVREHGSCQLYLSGSGNKLDALMYSILVLAAGFRIASAWNHEFVQWFVAMLALALSVHIFQILRKLSVFKGLGTLWIHLLRITKCVTQRPKISSYGRMSCTVLIVGCRVQVRHSILDPLLRHHHCDVRMLRPILCVVL